MWAFLIIDVCDKMSDAISRLGDALILIEVNFFLLEVFESCCKFLSDLDDLRCGLVFLLMGDVVSSFFKFAPECCIIYFTE